MEALPVMLEGKVSNDLIMLPTIRNVHNISHKLFAHDLTFLEDNAVCNSYRSNSSGVLTVFWS